MSSTELLREFDPRKIYVGPGIRLGEGDIFIGGETEEVFGRAAGFLFLGVRTAEGYSVFEGITVVAPPRLAWDRSDDEILGAILRGIGFVRSQSFDKAETESLRRRLKVTRCDQLDVAQVVNATSAAGPKQLICIIEAAKYKDAAIPAPTRIGRSGTVLAEDEWILHLASLASRCIGIAKEHDCYLLIESPESPPQRESSIDMLKNLEGLYPVLIEHSSFPADLVLKKADQWVAMALTGRLREAIAEIESTDIDRTYKTQLVIQVACRANKFELAAQTIRDELASGLKLAPSSAVRFGRVAERGGDARTAEKLLAESIPLVADRFLLESALQTATSLENVDLVDAAFGRLVALFPSSVAAEESRELRLFRCCQATQDSDSPAVSHAGFSESHQFLAGSLYKRAAVDYQAVVNAFVENWPAEVFLSTMCSALHAQSSRRSIEAIEMAMAAAKSDRYERQATQVVLHAIRRMMLMDEVPY